MPDRPTRATDPTLPVTALAPLYDDSHFLALVPGDWTRGQAVATVSRAALEAGYDMPFIAWRCRRAYFRWAQFATTITHSGWSFPDGMLTGCEKGDQDAERYWEVSCV